MDYTIIHSTIYTYNQQVGLCHNVAKLIPRNTDKQTIKKSTVVISPTPDITNEYTDFFGNKTLYFAVQQQHKELAVTVTSEITKLAAANVEMSLYAHLPWLQTKAEILALLNQQASEVGQFILPTLATLANADIEAFTKISFTPERSIFDACLNLMRRIFTEFQFKPGFTTISTPVSVVMKERKGVCQDFAHLAIACVRCMGLPARYVSGYVETIPPKGVEKLVGVDASHAWFSVFIPHAGWVDFDPTNNQIPSTQHITVGWGRDYFDVAPLKGVIQNSGPHSLRVSVDVRRSAF